MTAQILAAVLKTTEKNVALRAARMKLTPVCSRCCGTGQYSFNQVDGTRCYGCSGFGVEKLTQKNINSTIEAAKAAAADGRLDTHIAGVVSQREVKKVTDRMFAAWKATAAAIGNPHHCKRDEDCTDRELACRQGNKRISDAFHAADKINPAYVRNATPEAWITYKNATDAFFAVVEDVNAELA